MTESWPSTEGLEWPVVGANGVPDPTADPFAAYKYLDARRQNLILSARQRPLVRLWDENMNYIGTVANERSVQCEELSADTGGASLVIRRDGWLSDFIMYDRRAEQDLHLTIDPMPSMISRGDGWRRRWGGKITSVNAKRDTQGLHTIEMNAVSNREHLKHILASVNPVFVPEVAMPKMYVTLMNCRTNLTVALFLNLARQFFPLLSIPANIFNPGAWLNNSLANLDPLNWPIQPQWINPLFDTSRLEAFASRWQDLHSTSAAILDDAGCQWRAYTFLKGEDTVSPHEELAALGGSMGQLGDMLGITGESFMPKRSAVVLAVEDKSGIVGPTGTLVDGPINMIAATADSLVTETLIPEYDKDGDGQTDPLIRKWFGVAPDPPSVIFRDGEYSGIVESQKAIHGVTAKSVVVGGKSPGWLNDMITFGIRYGLSQLSALIYFAQPGGEGSYQQPGTPGLEGLYNGELDDTFFAYQRYTDPLRQLRTGDYGFLETFQQGPGTAYTISGVLSLRAGHFKTRAYSNYKTTVRNASPFIYGVDYDLGDRVGFEMANVIYVDQVSGVRLSWDVNKPVSWQIAIGNDTEDEDPVSKAMRAIAGIWNMFGMFSSGGDVF